MARSGEKRAVTYSFECCMRLACGPAAGLAESHVCLPVLELVTRDMCLCTLGTMRWNGRAGQKIPVVRKLAREHSQYYNDLARAPYVHGAGVVWIRRKAEESGEAGAPPPLRIDGQSGRGTARIQQARRKDGMLYARTTT
jgi:hypothetical protein